MKKVLLPLFMFVACFCFTNQAAANTVSVDGVSIVDVAPDPAQKIIEKLGQWTLLTQYQMDQITAYSSNYTWTSIDNPTDFKAQLKLLKADIKPLFSDVQYQEIKDAQ